LVVNGFVDLDLNLGAGFSILDPWCWRKITKGTRLNAQGTRLMRNYD
jgi:hypothetical protein